MKQLKSPAVTALIAVNALFFAATYLTSQNEAKMIELFALHFPLNERIRVWQFVSHMFMHGSFAHILFNMFALYSFGGPLEKIWGARRFLTFYFIAGLGAGLIYTGVNYYEFNAIQNALSTNGYSVGEIQGFLDTARIDSSRLGNITREELVEMQTLFRSNVLGASGAVYGVLVAFAMLFPNAKLALIFLPVPVAAKFFVPVLLLLDLFSGVTGFSLFGGGIAHFAHIGGAIIGFSLMLYWRKTLSPDLGRARF